MFQYLSTGDRRFRDAVIGLGEWVVALDDGRRTPFRWLTTADTGHASSSGSSEYHGPGRGGAYSIETLINAHRLTGDARFKNKAEALIRRCIHPFDDIPARNLLDAERRWSYTVFLQVLGRYLDWKAEASEHDDMYAYAQASLLAYVRWAAEHEYPYLDRPEILDYPTETWAAQELRKADFFAFAARHSDGVWRDRFLERSRYFLEYTIQTLPAMRSHVFARPLVIALSNGCCAIWLLARPGVSGPVPARQRDWPAPMRFVPQKTVAKQRLPAATIALALALLVFWALLAGVVSLAAAP
jgi:hypothetical protein